MSKSNHNTIIDFLSEYTPISKELEEVILQHGGIRTLDKDSIFLKEGQVAKECFFILKGCAKKYFLIDGEEKITGFFTEGQVVIPASYTTGDPSKYYISTIEETIGAFGTAESEKEALEKHPELAPIQRIIADKLMVNISDEFDNWVSHGPEERYLLLVKNRPELLKRVPQYQIANYLGIKPESLSRIRKRLAK